MSITLLSATVELFNKRLQEMEAKVETVEAQKGDKGDRGEAGKAGRDGKDGRDGAAGLTGPSGKDGVDGVDGNDGVSVVDATIDIDGHLVLTLSNGNELDAGDLTDTFQNSDKIVQIIRGGGGGRKQAIIEGIQTLSVDMIDLETDPLEYELDFNSFDISRIVNYAFYNKQTGCEVSVFNCKKLTSITMQSLLPLDDIFLQVEYI